jgi:predicted site-specific integrase-resolvase
MNKRLKDYAKEMGVTYRAAQNWHYDGKLDSFKSESGSIYVRCDDVDKKADYIVVYARVSSSQNKDNLEAQADRLVQYANAKGYQVKEVIKEIGSGINDNRTKLNNLLENEKVTKVIVEHKDRLTRLGFNYIKTLWARIGCEIEVVNEVDSNKEDLIQDFTSIITSFCARIYGQRRNKRKTEKLIRELGENK